MKIQDISNQRSQTLLSRNAGSRPHSEQTLSMLTSSTTQASNREANNPNFSRLPKVPPIGGGGSFPSKASQSPTPSFPFPKMDSAASPQPLQGPPPHFPSGRDIHQRHFWSHLRSAPPPAANPHKAPRWAQHDKQAPAARSSAERARRGRGGILRGCHSRLPRL